MQDLTGPFKQALKKLEKGDLHVTHVGHYEDRIVIVLHEDKKTKDIKVIDLTKNPQEGTSPEMQAKAVTHKKKPQKPRKVKGKCRYCGKAYKREGSKDKHEEVCPKNKFKEKA